MNLREIGALRKVIYLWRSFLDRHSYSRGSNNQIIKKGISVNSRIQITGNGNKVILEKGTILKNSLIKILGSDNVVHIHKDAFVSGAELWVEDHGCRIEIGERSFIGHHSHLACTEDSRALLIGRDCMISSNVQIRTGDSHSIMEENGNRINVAVSVSIGDHCWIGEGAKVLKGVVLDGDDVVSTGAIVTHSFGKNLLIGGVPSRVLKERINWDKARI